MRSVCTIEFLYLWESLNNDSFKPIDFEGFKLKSVENSFTLSHKKLMAMSESLTDRIEPQSRRGAGEARFGAKSLMQDKASYLALLRIRDYVVAYPNGFATQSAHMRRISGDWI